MSVGCIWNMLSVGRNRVQEGTHSSMPNAVSTIVTVSINCRWATS